MGKKDNSFQGDKISETAKNSGVEVYNSNLRKSGNVPIDVPLSFWNVWHMKKSVTESEEPSFSFKVVVSKVDSIVHAGNADLILELLKMYNGIVQMYVIRPETDTGRVFLEKNSDDIWAKGIRNGEKMLFDFYGPVPDQRFLKELSIRVNKYIEMDKIIP